jgi:Rrf2 family protein
MRVLSKKTKYALRALYRLGRNYGVGPMLIADLAEEESIPRKFLEQILLQLKLRGVIGSRPGRGGGCFLTRPPGEITIGTVVRAIEGPLAPLACASETAYRACEECPDANLCGTRLVMRQVRDATAGVLDNTTIADVCREIEKKRSLLYPQKRSGARSNRRLH